MDAIVLKTFLPEIFFSLAILYQVILNTKNVNDLKYNFPVLQKEVYFQTLFVLFLLILFFLDLKLEGFLGTHTLSVNEGISTIKLIFVMICICVLVIVQQAQEFQKISFFEYYHILSLSILGLLLMVSSEDLLIFYLVMETQALCFYVLGSSNRTSIFAIESGLKYFISGSFMSGAFLLGTSFIYGSLGTLNINHISMLLSFDLMDYNSSLNMFLSIGILLVMSALLFKVACAPFHFWSPDVYDGAPIYATVIFSIIPKLPLYFFIMKFFNSIAEFQIILQPFLIVCGILSILIGTFFAYSQKRLKRLIVYSSVAQTGFIVLGISLYTVDSYSNSIFFLVLYLLTSILVWGYFISFYQFSYKTKNFYEKESDSLYLSTLSNLSKYNVIWSLSFVIIFFSIAGIPPLSGFLSKMLILFSLVNNQKLVESILVVIISSVSVYYYIRVLKVVYFEPKEYNNSSEFKINFNSRELDSFILLSILIFFVLLFAFYNPSTILLYCQKISLTAFEL